MPDSAYHMLVALCEVNDGDLFELLAKRRPKDFSPPLVRALSALSKDLQLLINEYDFTQSEAFLASIEGKSASFASMARKLASEGVHRRVHNQEFLDAIMRLPSSRDVFRLVANRHHSTLESLRAAIDDNPATGEPEAAPRTSLPPRTFLCPPGSRPSRNTISQELEFNVPLAFAQLVEWIYDKANGDPFDCDELFSNFVGLYATDTSARYDSTPCELFPFASAGVDGVHYGYLVHAPELISDDYPVCYYCPADSDGVVIEGANTYEGFASTIAVWGNPELRPDRPEWQLAFGQDYRDDIVIELASVVAVPPNWTLLPSSDGVGVLAPSRLFGSRPVAIDPRGPVDAFLVAADAAIKKGHLATALFYLREGYWFNWFNHPIHLGELMCDVYDKLGRSSLAKAMQTNIHQWRKNA